VIETLAAEGVRGFDVASIGEVELVKAHAPDARMAFMHPVKSRSAIARAYFDYGVRTFAVDTIDELEKMLDVTGGRRTSTSSSAWRSIRWARPTRCRASSAPIRTRPRRSCWPRAGRPTS